MLLKENEAIELFYWLFQTSGIIAIWTLLHLL